MSHGHFVDRCKHGVVVVQCRCWSKDKRVTIVACPPDCSRTTSTDGTTSTDEQAAQTIELLRELDSDDGQA